MPMLGPVTFYSPNLVLGGTEMVFARLGALLQNEGRRVRLLDQPSGTLRHLACGMWKGTSSRVSPGPSETDPGCLVTTPKFLSHLLSGYPALPPLTRVVIYQVHPMEWAGAFYPGLFRCLARFGPKSVHTLQRLVSLAMPWYPARARQALEHWFQCRGLCFMDQPNLDGTRELLGLSARFTSPEHLLPILAATETIERKPFQPADPLRFFYFGRISDFKTPILLDLVYDLRVWANLHRSIHLTFIGDGDGVESVKACAMASGCPGLITDFLGSMPLIKAQTLMAAQADAVFAMGSSALDSGIAGVPTIVINTLAPQSRGRIYASWLHDQVGYSLGSYDASRYSTRPLTIAQACQEIAAGHAPHDLMRPYVIAAHGSEAVTQRLLEVLDNTGLRLADLQNVRRRLWPAGLMRNTPSQPVTLEAWA